MAEEKKPAKQEECRNADGTFVKGVSGNPAGRKPGLTIKERIRNWLDDHPDDMDKFIEYFVKDNRDLAWQMLEGRPSQDLTSAGEKIMPNPILGSLTIPHDKSKKPEGTDNFTE